MFKRIIKFFATGEDKPILKDDNLIKKMYKNKRNSVFISLVFGYGFFYTTRLSLSVAKKQMVDTGILDVTQLGIIGAVLLYVYAIGKFTNGFLADRANIRKFMSIALMGSAVINLIFGFTDYFIIFAIFQ